MTTITLPRATVEQALEALRRATPADSAQAREQLTAITALRAALAQQAEPVAWEVTKDGRVIYDYDFAHDVVLRVMGDFENDEQRVCYAKQIVDKLNATLAQQDEPVLVQGELPPRYVARSPVQAEPMEPVAWRYDLEQNGSFAGVSTEYSRIKLDKIGKNWTPLYTAPPQRTIVPLTDEELLKAIGWERAEMYMKLAPNFPLDEAKQETLTNARAVEKAVWEKNYAKGL